MPRQPNLEADHHILAVLNCPYISNICTKLESWCFTSILNIRVAAYFFHIHIFWEDLVDANIYIEDIQMFVVNTIFIPSCEVKKCIFHSCLWHS